MMSENDFRAGLQRLASESRGQANELRLRKVEAEYDVGSTFMNQSLGEADALDEVARIMEEIEPSREEIERIQQDFYKRGTKH